MTRVLVTGAGGFVGRRLCDALVAGSHCVSGTIRSTKCGSQMPKTMSLHITGDVEQFDGWESITRSTDVVVHLIARTHATGEHRSSVAEAYRQVNVRCTRRLVRACVANRVRRIVFVSSIKAVGEGITRPYVETDLCQPEDAYGRTKREAEQLLYAETLEGDTEWTCVRPPLVYGPYAKGNVKRILQAVADGIPLPLAGLRNSRSMVYVDNLVSAIQCVITHPAARDQLFHVADDEAVSTTHFVRSCAAGLGIKPRLFYTPKIVLQSLARVMGRHNEVRRLLGSLTVSNEKLKRLTSWRPHVAADQAAFMTGRAFSMPQSRQPSRPDPHDAGLVDIPAA